MGKLYAKFALVFVQISEEDFARFKASVMEECGSSRGVDESIFQDPKLLHLTVVTMANMGKRAIEVGKPDTVIQPLCSSFRCF